MVRFPRCVAMGVVCAAVAVALVSAAGPAGVAAERQPVSAPCAVASLVPHAAWSSLGAFALSPEATALGGMRATGARRLAGTPPASRPGDPIDASRDEPQGAPAIAEDPAPAATPGGARTVSAAGTKPIANTVCAGCHDEATSGFTTAKVDFEVASVDRATACAKCHWEPAGAHPYHNSTWNCSSCHVSMGFVDPSAIPRVSTAYGWFATASSADAGADELHAIHANPTWAGTLTKKGRQCASCHAPAACTACHGDLSVDPGHAQHSWDESSTDYWPGTGPEDTVYGRGTTPGNEGERTVGPGLTCSNQTCHPAPTGVAAPYVEENRASQVVYSGTWGRSGTSGYTANSYSIAAAAGARATLTFTGTKVALVSDAHPYRGQARIILDGVTTATIDCYAPSTTKQIVVWESPELAAGEHTVTVEVLGTKDAASKATYVVVDAFRVTPIAPEIRPKCSGCHGVDPHPAADHTVGGLCTPSGCHVTDAADIHADGPACFACHSAGVTPTFACGACHSSPHPEANHGSADTCTSCHSTGKITGVHADVCTRCHAAPAQGMTWDGTCSQTGCHPAYHSALPIPQSPHPSNHGEGDDCWDCHDGWGGCDSCHPWAYERAAPLTTSNAIASYTSVAVIRLTAVDQGQYGTTVGVMKTYYQVDGGAVQTGGTVVVPGPSSGVETHTLEFWSTDWNYNTETHRVVYFRVFAGPPDTNPPTGTMSINGGAVYANSTAMTVDSSIVDTHTGVAAMRIDPGTGTYGSWTDYSPAYPINAPAGNGVKTVRAEYRDAYDNTISRTDTITMDATAPSGTMLVNAGATYTTSTAVTVDSSVSDALSGMADMRINSGVGGWGAWIPYASTRSVTIAAGSGARTVSIQYRDAAGNMIQRNDTIILDPDPPTGTMSVNGNATYATGVSVMLDSAITDARSGVSQMRVDPGSGTFGAWVAYAASHGFALPSGDGTKTVRAEYRDGAGNVLGLTDPIVLDTTAPTGTMVVASGAATTSVRSVTVDSSMSDATSGMNQMRFDPGTGAYDSWIAYAPTHVITLPSGFGVKTVRAEYRDKAGLTASRTDTITLEAGGGDDAAPTGSVAINAGASVTGTTSVVLSLTATDTGGSGLAQMRFSNDNATWSSWEAFGTSREWSLSGGDDDKIVYVMLRDGAGNLSSVFSDGIALNTAPPSAVVALSFSDFTWVDANGDASGAWGTYRIYVNDTLVGTKTAGPNATWSCPGTDLPTGGHIDVVVDCGFSSYSWIFDESRPSTFTLALPPGTTRLEASTWTGFPNVGVGGDWYDPYDDYYLGAWIPTATIGNIRLTPGTDIAPPTGSVAINSGAAYATSTAVSLALSASDPLGSGVTMMRLSDDGLAWSAWQPYATSRSWTLPSGDGPKTVYAQFRDDAGNISVSYSDAIHLDATAPTGAVVINDGATSTVSAAVTLTVSAADTGGSGSTQMRFSNDNASWSSWEAYATSKPWMLTPGFGSKTVYAQFRDAAGNVSATYSDGIMSTAAGGTATLQFRWWGMGEADLHLENSIGQTIATTSVSGYYEDLSWYVEVAAGENYYMVCDYYYDWDWDEVGGGYGRWSNDPTINPDGILSAGETVIWNY